MNEILSRKPLSENQHPKQTGRSTKRALSATVSLLGQEMSVGIAIHIERTIGEGFEDIIEVAFRSLRNWVNNMLSGQM